MKCKISLGKRQLNPPGSRKKVPSAALSFSGVFCSNSDAGWPLLFVLSCCCWEPEEDAAAVPALAEGSVTIAPCSWPSTLSLERRAKLTLQQ